MQYKSSPTSYRSPAAPSPAVPMRVSLAAAVLVPLAVLTVLHPGGISAAALLVAYLAGRHR